MATRRTQRLLPFRERERRLASSLDECNKRGFRHREDQVVGSWKTHFFGILSKTTFLVENATHFGDCTDFSGFVEVQKHLLPDQNLVQGVLRSLTQPLVEFREDLGQDF